MGGVPSYLKRTITPAIFAKSCSGGRWAGARHLYEIDRAIVDAVDGRRPERIIVVEAPPRHGKSQFCSRWVPAWYLGDRPNDRVILTSYSASLATNFGRSARDIIREHGHEFGYDLRVRSDSSAASDWGIEGHDGGMVTAGVGGPITGRGANLAIIDDPIKNAEEALSDRIRESQIDWFKSTLWTRIEPGGVLLVIQTRWHKEDLAGWILTHARDEMQVPVRHLSFPAVCNSEDDALGRKVGDALWPERWPVAELERIKKLNQGYWWDALYQQKPGVYGNNEWPDTYFGDHLWSAEWPDQFECSVICIDPSKGKDAKRGDYSAIVFAGFARGLIWIRATVERRPIEKIVRDTLRMSNQTAAMVLGVEENAFQFLIKPEIERTGRELGVLVPEVKLMANTVSKEIRISRLGPMLEQKRLRINRDAGGELLVKQMKDFPNGDHDDGPDATEMAIRLLRHQMANSKQSREEERWNVW